MSLKKEIVLQKCFSREGAGKALALPLAPKCGIQGSDVAHITGPPGKQYPALN